MRPYSGGLVSVLSQGCGPAVPPAERGEGFRGREISLLREGASIAFVWTPAFAAAPPNAVSGQKPGPTSSQSPLAGLSFGNEKFFMEEL